MSMLPDDMTTMYKQAFLGKYYPKTKQLIDFLRVTNAPIVKSIPPVASVTKGEMKPAVKAMAKDFPWWLTGQHIDHPVRSVLIDSALATAAASPVVYQVNKAIGRNELKGTDNSLKDEVLSALSDPLNMTNKQKLDATAGAGAALLGGAGLYSAMQAIPGLRKRKILRAVLATLGAGGIGYGAWKAADNIQTNTMKGNA